jgi:CheY-like chemotaxis protein
MSPGQNKLLMIAEDDEDDQLMLKQALQRAEFEGAMEFCADGVALLERLMDHKRRAPDLLLLDLNMPRKTGQEALQWIRSMPDTRSIPVVILSTSDRPSDVRACYDMGANAYLCKPAGLDPLRDMVASMTRFWFADAKLPSDPQAA